MTASPDLTRWNRAGLRRLTYVDGNAPLFLELLRAGLAGRFSDWDVVHDAPDRNGGGPDEDERKKLNRILAQYAGDRRDIGWEIARVLSRACHVLTGHLDAYANEGYLGTATEWDSLRRLVEMLDYHPAPPASAATPLVLVAKPKASGTVAKGFQVKHAPKGGAPVVFETLDEVGIHADLNELRPAGHDRNPAALTGSTLIFDEAVKHVKTGEPIVLEDERSGTLRAYLVQGVLEQDERTEITVRPTLWRGFVAGYTLVHAQPADRLDPLGPAASGAEIGRVLRLASDTGGFKPGEVVYISDRAAGGRHAYYRRVVDVRGLALILDRDVGPLTVADATVARPDVVGVNRVPGRELGDRNILVMRVPGDRSELTDARIADLCIAPGGRSIVAEYSVMTADYVPAKADDPNAGYTVLRVDAPTDAPYTLANPQAVWVPPAGGGSSADQYIEKVRGHLPTALVTEKSKKLAAGDLAVVVRGNQMAWARLATVAVDADAGEATVVAHGRWQDRGGGDFYLADTKVYGHFKQSLRVSRWQANPTVVSGSTVELATVPQTLRPGAKVLVECAEADPFVTAVSLRDGALVTLADDLPDGCTLGSLVLRGNVVTAGHGESKAEKVLGTGSAAALNQAFVLEVEEVSFVADPTQTTGVRADLAVRVSGQEWKQVATLNDSNPADAHYVVRMTEDGYVTVRFGDGTNGRRLPSGAGNVRVSYRKGTGLRGNLVAGSLTKPVKPHALVESVRQPLRATGGNDVEPIESLRENAPASLLTLERAVSLSDFGHLAASHSSVWEARAFRHPSGARQAEQIEVVVVPADGGPLGGLTATLTDFVLAHAVPGVAVWISPYSEVTFDVDIELTVDEEAYVADDVRLAVEDAVTDAFTLAHRRLGEDVYSSEVYNVVENVEGVIHSTIVLNGDRAVRRLRTDERSVRVLGGLVVRLKRTAPALVTAPISTPPASGEEPVLESRIGRRGSIVVDGVGPEYAERLADNGASTVRQLAALEPDGITLDMPRPKLWEAVAKAQLLTETDIDPDLPTAVLDRSLLDVGTMALPALRQLTGGTAQQAESLRAVVRRLQVALDDEVYARITLREFVKQ